jgi:L-iditol 2-dehydrogenase
MIGATVAAPGRIEIAEFPIPAAGPGEVLLRMKAASICGSDLHVAFDGFARTDQLGQPGYPGHEGVGEVLACESGRMAIGTQVLAVPPGQFGRCFAQYQVVEERWVVPLPADADLERSLMAQQLGTTIYAMRRFWSGPGAKVATVIGAGSAGLFFVQQLVRLGFEKIVVSDLEPYRLDVAQRLGATVVTTGRDRAVVDATLEASDGRGSDLVIEAAGYDDSRSQAIDCAAKFSRVGYFGYPQSSAPMPFPLEQAFRKSLQISLNVDTSFEDGLRSYREALAAIGSGEIEVDYCLSEMIPIANGIEAFDRARNGADGVVKVRLNLE